VGQTNFKESKSRKSSTVKAKKERFNDAEFVNYELGKDEQARCKAWQFDLDTLSDALLRLADSGYVVSCKFDTYSEAHSAFLRQAVPDGENAGYILSGRGSSPLKALKQVIFKHFVLFEQSWAQYSTPKITEDYDD